MSRLKYILLTRNHLLISPLKEKCHHINRGNWILKKWKTIGTKLRYNSEFVSVFDDKVILPSGQEIEYTKIELRDFVSVISLIDNKIVMIEILRYPRNCISLEIPSGHIEDGESAEEAAVRELEEENGVQTWCYNKNNMFSSVVQKYSKCSHFLCKLPKERDAKT